MAKSKTDRRDMIRNARKRGALYGFVLVTFFIAVESIIFLSLNIQISTELDELQRSEIEKLGSVFKASIKQVENEFMFFSEAKLSSDCLSTVTTYEDASPSCNQVASMMKTMMTINRNINQLRLLDLKGQEIVRLNHNRGVAIKRVGQDKLQNKKNRPYFVKTLKNKQGQIYISAIDLNVENGKVDDPPRPMIRYAKLVYDEAQKPIGVAIVNYLVRDFIENIGNSIDHEYDRWYFLNDEGFYLKGPTSASEFSFMYTDKQNSGFFLDHPKHWQAFLKDSDSICENEMGRFYFHKVNALTVIPNVIADEGWVIILNVPKEIVDGSSDLLMDGLCLGALLLCPLLAFLGFRNGSYRVKQKWYLDELTRNAITDNLTGLLNRRGLKKQLTWSIEVAKRRKCPLTVVFVDVNDLKTLNDTHGHKMGDLLIKTTADFLAKTVRKSDIIGRLGGDEFVMALTDCDLISADEVMQRVSSDLDGKGKEITGTPWTVSFGCTNLEEHDTADTMIRRADKLMYKDKIEYKTGRHSLPPNKI